MECKARRRAGPLKLRKERLHMELLQIAPPRHDVIVALAYATADNVLGKPIYRHPRCYLHRDAEACLAAAISLAGALGYRLKIFDAFRPSEAQWIMWNRYPQPGFFADPRKGSPHSRGVAVDLTLVDASGRELDMGTGFDDMTDRAHHACLEVSTAAQRNRALLLGLMTAAGWDFYGNEWWHYQLFHARGYPLYSDSALNAGLM
jgi:D-alanyl-D-alanine dipeptidase